MNTHDIISTGDQILATLTCNGKVLARISQSNFSSLSQIVRFITRLAGRFMGMARLTVRNKTQGWSRDIALASQMRMPTLATATPAHDGLQYRLW